MNGRRYQQGQSVWISPGLSGRFLRDDEAIVMDDLEDGYIVFQESELVPSHGSGHFVQDTEVLPMMI